MKGWFQFKGRCTSPQIDGAGVVMTGEFPPSAILLISFILAKVIWFTASHYGEFFGKFAYQCEVLEVLMTQDDVRTFSGHVFGRLSAWGRWEIRKEEEI